MSPTEASAALQVRATKDYCNNYDLTSLNVKAGDIITVMAPSLGHKGGIGQGAPPLAHPALPCSTWLGPGAAPRWPLEGLHPRQPDGQRPCRLLPSLPG